MGSVKARFKTKQSGEWSTLCTCALVVDKVQLEPVRVLCRFFDAEQTQLSFTSREVSALAEDKSETSRFLVHATRLSLST